MSVNGVDLEYRMIGLPTRQAPTLVLLHEGLGCAAMWRDIPQRLAERTGMGVFAYSRQGYGGSAPCQLPRPLSYMRDEADKSLPLLLDAIGLERGLLVGHSDGASIATAYCATHHDPRIVGLILLAPHVFVEETGLAAIAAAKTAYQSGDLRSRLSKYHGANVDCAFWGWNDSWLHPDFKRWDLRADLPRIQVPILILQGDRDPFGTMAQVQAYQNACQTAVTVHLLADCGHDPARERTEQTIASIAEFAGACARQDASNGLTP